MMQELLFAPQAMKKVVETNGKIAKEIAKKVKENDIKFVATVARGTSDNAAWFFKYQCEKKSGLMVAKFYHSVNTILHSKVNMSSCLCLAISQSGMSTDTINVVSMAKESGALTVGVTNNENSPLAKMCDFHLYLNCEEEKSVAATKTFTLELACLELLSNALGGLENPNFDKISNDMIEFSKCFDKIKFITEETKNDDNMIILSRGETLGVADEMSLKLLETCYKFSRTFSVAEFIHGPFAVLDATKTAIILAPDGKYTPDFVAMATKLKNIGAKIVAFTDIEELQKISAISIRMPKSKSSSIYLYTLAIQAYAAYLSEKLGNNPDNPRGLNKVTITI